MRESGREREPAAESTTRRRPPSAGGVPEHLLRLQRAAGNAAVSGLVGGTVQRMVNEEAGETTPLLAAPAPVASTSTAPAAAPLGSTPAEARQQLQTYRDRVTDPRVGGLMDEGLAVLDRVRFEHTGENPGAYTTREAAGEDGRPQYRVRYGQAPTEGQPELMARVFHELYHAVVNEQLNGSDMLNVRVPPLPADQAGEARFNGPGGEEQRQEARLGLAGEDNPDLRARRTTYVKERALPLLALVARSGLSPAHQEAARSRITNMMGAPLKEYDPILVHLLVLAEADGLRPGNAFYDRADALLQEARAKQAEGTPYPIASARATNADFGTGRLGGLLNLLYRIRQWFRVTFPALSRPQVPAPPG